MSTDGTIKAEGNTQAAGAWQRPDDYQPPLSITLPEILRNGSDSAFRELIWQLLVVAKRIHKYPEIFGHRIGISSAQYTVLIATAHMQGSEGIGIRALADYIHLPAPHITTTVGLLVDAGLLAKRQNPEDGRGVLVSMTEAGDAALRELAPFQQQINDELFAGLSRADFAAFTRLVGKFVGNTQRAFDKAGALQQSNIAPRKAAE